MKANDKFKEVKIRMVMKLRGLTRDEAIKELHLDSPVETEVCEIKHPDGCKEPMITANEFFAGLEDDGAMSAEEFFGED